MTSLAKNNEEPAEKASLVQNTVHLRTRHREQIAPNSIRLRQVRSFQWADIVHSDVHRPGHRILCHNACRLPIRQVRRYDQPHRHDPVHARRTGGHVRLQRSPRSRPRTDCLRGRQGR